MIVRNSEGYMDLTAGIAVQRASRKEKRMRGTAKPAEIWMVESPQGETPALILADNGYKATVIKLQERPAGEESVRIVYQGERYVSPYMIQYTHSEKCIGYEKTVTDAEYDAVREAIVYALNLVQIPEEPDVEQSQPDTCPEPQACATKEPVAALMETDTSESEELKEKIHSLETSLARCEGERDVYRDLFMATCTK